MLSANSPGPTVSNQRFSLVRRLSRSGRWRHGAALNTDARSIRVPRYMCLASRQLLISRLDSGRSMHSLYYVRDQRFTTLLVARSAHCKIFSCAARVHGSWISNRRDFCSPIRRSSPRVPMRKRPRSFDSRVIEQGDEPTSMTTWWATTRAVHVWEAMSRDFVMFLS